MYPFINALWTQFHMTWIGIIIFLAVFLRRTKLKITKFQGDRSVFWKHVPMYVVIIYLASSYARYLIEELVIIPTSLNQIMAYISPYEYKFHLVWLIWGIGRCVWHFFQHVQDTNMQLKWIDSRFLAAMWWCIPLGIFLLLGDTFIGQPADSGIFVSAFHPDSKLATYDTVIPLGLYLSLLWLLLLFGTKILRYNKTQLRWYGLVWWILFLVLFSFLILFQEYARHIVFKVFDKTRDIRNIVLLASAWFIYWKYRTKYSFFSQLQ